MLNDTTSFKKIYIACGYTDLRLGIDGLASYVKYHFELDPFDKDTLFLFCGRKATKIKGLVWEGDGFLLLYKRLEVGSFSWPRSTSEAMALSPDQYKQLMEGFSVVAKHPISKLTEPKEIV